MNLKFSNLGKINEANLELGDFTLIVGDNSLGKTILLESYALYLNVMRDQISEFIKWKYIHNVKIEKDNTIEQFEDLQNERIELPITFDLKDTDSLNEVLINYQNKYLKLLKENILNSKEFNTEVQVSYNKVDITQFPSKIIIFNRKSIYFAHLRFGKRVVRFRVPQFKENNSKRLMISFLESRIEQFLNTQFFKELCGLEELMFFPSERNLYKTNAYKKSAEFIENSFSQIDKDNEMRYSESLFVKNYFEYLEYLDFTDGQIYDEEKVHLYNLICKSLGGQPKFEEGVITSIQQKNNSISQKMFSTKQHRLLPYLMLCTSLVDSVDRIIIEEPEAHMSLKSMFELVEITEILLEQSKIIMTSHSDIFVTLLNNLIKRNNVNAKVYELIENEEGIKLNKVNPGTFGYELTFMSEQITRLNNETLEAFKDGIESDEY